MGTRLVAVTDVGRKRKHNEDSVLGSPDLGLLLVADGMGGHLHGEVASRMALDTLVEHYQSRLRTVAPDRADPKEEEEFLRFAIEKANGAIFRKGDEDVNFNDMGTTIVALAVRPGYVVIGNVGDSRAYRLRGKRLRQLTRDHSWVGELWEKKLISKETAMIHPERNV
ncbi:MAG: protein phosphatase 2C domain-containing protein, partial [Planctomycetales bacterium]|nr:protein phosphatase 2C domain-containing protein [Planctomycetales bacterium]